MSFVHWRNLRRLNQAQRRQLCLSSINLKLLVREEFGWTYHSMTVCQQPNYFVVVRRFASSKSKSVNKIGTCPRNWQPASKSSRSRTYKKPGHINIYETFTIKNSLKFYLSEKRVYSSCSGKSAQSPSRKSFFLFLSWLSQSVHVPTESASS